VTDDINLSSNLYYTMIEMAIKSNNLVGLEILWEGIYHHDRACPDFLDDLYTATKYGNLKTLQHVFYAYNNYSIIDY
jgi:hypothetical protein